MSKIVENCQKKDTMDKKMKTKKKTILIFVVLALIFTFLMSSTMAFYIAKRSATGTLSFDKGIFLEFGNVEGDGYSRNLLLTDGSILNISVVPNQVVEIKNPYIKALDNSIPFYLKARLTYFTIADGNLLEVDKSKLDEIVVLNSFGNILDFNSNFLPDEDNNWFYYVADANRELSVDNLAAINPGEIVDIFATTSFKIANFNCETGSPNEIGNLIIKLEISAMQESDLKENIVNKESSLMSEFIVNVENGSIKYSVSGSAITILEINGTDVVINDGDLPVDEKEIIFAVDAFNNIGISANIDEKVIYLYDQDIVESLVLDTRSKGEELFGKIYLVTNQEIYDYIFNDLLSREENTMLALEIEAYSFVLLDTEV